MTAMTTGVRAALLALLAAALGLTACGRSSGDRGPGAVGQVSLAVAGDMLGVRQVAGGGADFVEDVAAQSDGGTVVTGFFHGTVDFGSSRQLTSGGQSDIFLARYNPNGTIDWVKRAGGTGADVANGIAVTYDGGIVITGYFSGTATFGTTAAGDVTLTSTVGRDIFVARYDAQGNVLWARQAGGTIGDVAGADVATQPGGACVVTGYYGGTVTFAPGVVLTSSGFRDIFVARYEADGTLSWVRSAGGSDRHDEGLGIAALPDNGAVVTGIYRSAAATFGPGYVLTPSPGTVNRGDIFVARYGSDGSLAWALRAGGGGEEGGEAVALLSTGDRVVVTGNFINSATLDSVGAPASHSVASSGVSDVFIAGYDLAGHVLWVNHGGGAQGDVGYGAAALPDGGFMLTGQFSGTATFRGTATLSARGQFDIFVVRFDANGTVTDAAGASDAATATEALAVYDPDAGFATGGGWISVPAGKAHFNVTAGYRRQDDTPPCRADLRLPGLRLSGTTCAWLVVTGSDAYLQGEGTLAGQPGQVSFFVAVSDGGQTDQIRFRITDLAGQVIYDTQPGDPIVAAPTLPVQGGDVAVHGG